MNNIKIKLSKALTNNYILLVLVSYIYLIIKINNNSFKELLTYIISVLLFYIYFKNLKNSYTFGFFVLLIRYTFKQIFNNIENFKENKEKNKEIEKRNKEKEIEKNKKDMDKQATTTEDDYTTEPIAKIDTGLTDEEIEEMKEDDTKTDSYVKSTENGVNDSADNADLGITI